MKQIITKKLVLIRQTADSFTAKILSFETVAKREAILNPVPKQRISLFRVTGLEPIRNARKSLSTDLVNTNIEYRYDFTPKEITSSVLVNKN